MKVAVFLGAQEPKNKIYVELVERIGELIGKKGHTLVFGGSGVGLMKVVADSAKDNGGYVIGVSTELFKHVTNPRCDEIEVLPTISLRKEKMANISDLFIIAPGGYGTLEEAADVISWKRMGITKGKTIFLNHEGFYEPIKVITNRMIEEGFIKDDVLEDVLFVDTVEEIEKYL